jgi:hypothetical protein
MSLGGAIISKSILKLGSGLSILGFFVIGCNSDALLSEISIENCQSLNIKHWGRNAITYLSHRF